MNARNAIRVWTARRKALILATRVINHATTTIGTLREELRRAEGTVGHRTAERDLARADVARLKRELGAACTANRNLTANNEFLARAFNHLSEGAEARGRRIAELEAALRKADQDHADLSGRLQDAEHTAELHRQHMDRCEVADALDAEDTHKRVIDQ